MFACLTAHLRNDSSSTLKTQGDFGTLLQAKKKICFRREIRVLVIPGGEYKNCDMLGCDDV
jgi:hypothetical protein